MRSLTIDKRQLLTEFKPHAVPLAPRPSLAETMDYLRRLADCFGTARRMKGPNITPVHQYIIDN